jgi:hypothetical protein
LAIALHVAGYIAAAIFQTVMLIAILGSIVGAPVLFIGAVAIIAASMFRNSRR